MTVRNLDRLLSPRSVALIGASGRSGSVGNIVARNMIEGGFRGSVSLVNPKGGELFGQPVYRRIEDLPEAPDLAVIVTPPETLPGIAASLAARGTRAAVVITAGIKGALRQQMLDAGKDICLRFQGPNCLGLMLPPLGLNASFCHVAPKSGDLAFLSQSGALITGIVDWAAARNIGFSHVVSLGDMADVDFGDLLDYLAGERQSRAILLYMESVTDAPKFLSAARRAARAKPVIVVKSGRHAAGAKAALSHTGALAGSDAAYAAAFRRAGLVRVKALGELFDAAEILARMPRMVGDKLTIITNGGGAGVLAADRLADSGGVLQDLSAETLAALDRVLPPTWSHGNPIDIIGDANAERYASAIEVVLAAPEAQALLVMNCPTALVDSTEPARALVDAIDRRAATGMRPRPVLACWLGDSASREARALFVERGLPSFETPADAVAAFTTLTAYRAAQDALLQMPSRTEKDFAFDRESAKAILAKVLADGRTVLSEMESKALLVSYGIPTVETEVAANAGEARAIAERLLAEHAACVVKILSHDITHKSDVGGVRLGLATADSVAAATTDMLERVRSLRPAARIDGVTVQPMVSLSAARELIAGMSVDESFGPMLTFGSGGTEVELVRDTAQALPPLDMHLAHDLIRQTRISRLFDAHRGKPGVDRDGVADVLVRLSYLVAEHPEIRELDINPLLAAADGVVALDARVAVADALAHPRKPMAIRPYPSEWETSVTLDRVGTLRLRPIRPADELLYERFFSGVTPDDMRLRFFMAHPGTSHAFLARLTQIDYAREMAFVALRAAADGDDELLGVVRLITDPDGEVAEYAVLVRSDLKGAGLGWALMQHMIAYARAHHIQVVQGAVLAENATMLSMCRELGFEVTAAEDDPQVRTVRLALSS
ncbi:MAG: bifunctional acetate--CoA ligase family protein/GNAT family N-acetyltransferase [Hyphomicrobiaceae bacterium]|nr:bifunctional acetate--CoA ligase family protein/GNAT family N-acetyltransferase [Hyphomicrobiaceae bacterium]